MVCLFVYTYRLNIRWEEPSVNTPTNLVPSLGFGCTKPTVLGSHREQIGPLYDSRSYLKTEVPSVLLQTHTLMPAPSSKSIEKGLLISARLLEASSAV